jgi:hypothetical protein
MTRIIALDIDEDHSIFIETNQVEAEETVDISLADTTLKAREVFAASVEKILPAGNVLMQKLRSLDVKPDEVEVAFGFNIGLQTGAVIASSTAAANFQVTLRWTKSE